MLSLTLVTQSLDKVDEFSRLLGRRIAHVHVDVPEVQSLDPAEVASHKARRAYDMLANTPVLVEDTGLSVQAWNGLPGALIKWFLKSVGPTGLCRMLKPFQSAKAVAETALAVCDGEVRVFIGRTSGVIAPEPAGASGFGWDAIFIPDGATRTFAEMQPDEKDAHSMRRRALEQLQKHYGNQ